MCVLTCHVSVCPPLSPGPVGKTPCHVMWCFICSCVHRCVLLPPHLREAPKVGRGGGEHGGVEPGRPTPVPQVDGEVPPRQAPRPRPRRGRQLRRHHVRVARPPQAELGAVRLWSGYGFMGSLWGLGLWRSGDGGGETLGGLLVVTGTASYSKGSHQSLSPQHSGCANYINNPTPP